MVHNPLTIETKKQKKNP